MLFTEFPLEILILIFDFVCQNDKFQILILRLLNKHLLSATRTFLKTKEIERQNFKFLLLDINKKYNIFSMKLAKVDYLFRKLIIDFLYITPTNRYFSKDFFCSSIILNYCHDEIWNKKIIINEHFNDQIAQNLDFMLTFKQKVVKLGETLKISSQCFTPCSKSYEFLMLKNFEFIDLHDDKYGKKEYQKCIFREGLETTMYRKFTDCKVYKRLNLGFCVDKGIPYREFVSEIRNFTKKMSFFNQEGKEIDIQNCDLSINRFSFNNSLTINLEGFVFYLRYSTF